jgi:hypothetical protein
MVLLFFIDLTTHFTLLGEFFFMKEKRKGINEGRLIVSARDGRWGRARGGRERGRLYMSSFLYSFGLAFLRGFVVCWVGEG